ncbi:molybdopterin biosynthesis protein [Alkaliphilus hydrothermalis]|uniref:Molybdopterin molybdenumtransferase n=1 Tax=Alkaliphilus hydrothermalis TaxID=1482730 RepID=A0ABS2NPJ9_9FIRM|nr:molybdopterin biosynthesis protein [Alkaliphilus hydrothermalis]MBM7614873.1 putative molybdopterin biosynthesis protein [Alkaliphilus hydrothermalis]
MKETRNIYLTNIPLKEAQETYINRIEFSNFYQSIEEIPVVSALGRVSVGAVFAERSSPNYNGAAMDGIAVIAEKTYGATETRPVELKKENDFVYINTGGCIKEPFNAVIMIEDIVILDDETVKIHEAARPWQHIRPIGEDIVAGELIISANHRIRPVDIGALLAGKIVKVKVLPLPRVGLIPTGSEIVDVSDELENGKIIESNTSMFAAMLQEYNGIPKRYPVVKDDFEKIKEGILLALEENDVVVINAGSSAGSRDFTVDVLREIGEVIIHGVATKPGKPVILAIVRGKPVVGIPGYPVSAYFTMEFFIKPLIAKYNKQVMTSPTTVKATLSRRIVSSLKHEEYVRMKMGKVGNKLIATPLERGAGVAMSLVRADGVLIIPQQLEGYDGGTVVDIQLMKPMEEIQETLVSIGSHDLVIDLLGNQIHETNSLLFLSSAHVGSLGGIMAMKKKECHLAPIHLMDTKTGEYNISYVRQYSKGESMALIKFVGRSQGLMVKKGNPKKIKGIADLAREEIHFVNRQRGAGTRILLDYYLNDLGIEPDAVQGYEREMTTHMAVAVAVSGGTADCGLGVYSAATTMGLDFIPIAWEDYDLLIPQAFLEDSRVLQLLEVMKSDAFVNHVNRLGGYNTESIGKVVLI